MEAPKNKKGDPNLLPAPDKLRYIRDLLRAKRTEIEAALPPNTLSAERLTRIALTAITKTPKLLSCDLYSLYDKVIQCSELGLEPSGALGHAWLLPFWNTKRNTYEVVLLIGYQGHSELAYRAGEIASIECRAVYRGDHFDYGYGLEPYIEHKQDLDNADEGSLENLRCVYSVIVWRDKEVPKKFIIMNKKQIDRHRKMSKAPDGDAWKYHYIAMAFKTAILQNLKTVRKSPEQRHAIDLDTQAYLGQPQSSEISLDGLDEIPADYTRDKEESKSDRMARQLAGAKKEEDAKEPEPQAEPETEPAEQPVAMTADQRSTIVALANDKRFTNQPKDKKLKRDVEEALNSDAVTEEDANDLIERLSALKNKPAAQQKTLV